MSTWSQRFPTFGATYRSESPLLPAKARVLIVDASRESRDILRTLLDRQGTDTLETAKIQAATTIAEREQPDLIICDADGDRSPANVATCELARQASRSAIPIVVLGNDSPRFWLITGRGRGFETLPLRLANP